MNQDWGGLNTGKLRQLQLLAGCAVVGRMEGNLESQRARMFPWPAVPCTNRQDSVPSLRPWRKRDILNYPTC